MRRTGFLKVTNISAWFLPIKNLGANQQENELFALINVKSSGHKATEITRTYFCTYKLPLGRAEK